MKAVVDTNVLIAAFLRDGTTREIFLDHDHNFLMPDHALEEFENHLPSLAERMHKPVQQARLAFLLLVEHTQTVEPATYHPYYQKAMDLLEGTDQDDAPFVALSFATRLPLWTNDRRLIDHDEIWTITTKDFLTLSKK